jgi:hypothetical protein|tara:strand:- start:7716 stop:8180 length:465 start_codon:yes stop_codon:yes gene_type:complete
MNKEIYILKRDNISIILNKTSEMFTINLTSEEGYNSEGFDEFLLYFKNTWETIRGTKDIYKLYINLETSKDNDLPLTAYMNILKCIGDIGDILKTNCHCICIFTHDCGVWQDAYNFIIKLWNTKDQRPIMFTDNVDDKNLFLQSNELITRNYLS